MKILRVVNDIYPSFISGMALHVHEMSKWQEKLGCEITVYTSKIGNDSNQEFRDGYEIVRFKPFIKIMGNSIIPTLVFKLINNVDDFDIIHAHSHFFFTTNVCSLVRKIKSVPLVITSHGLISQTAPCWFSNFYLSSVGKFTFNSADRIISYTDEEKEALTKLGIDGKKTKIIPNGIDIELFSPFCFW